MVVVNESGRVRCKQAHAGRAMAVVNLMSEAVVNLIVRSKQAHAGRAMAVVNLIHVIVVVAAGLCLWAKRLTWEARLRDRQGTPVCVCVCVSVRVCVCVRV